MTLDEFTDRINTQDDCPSSLPGALQALWYESKGDWDKAHQIVQDASDSDSAWVHAYLHRKEGDLGNARYWYRRANQLESKETLDQEWENIARVLLLASD
jgi:hypothetical protein